eukprot:1230792-Amorphochlora_amoeboformis.AAC.1
MSWSWSDRAGAAGPELGKVARIQPIRQWKRLSVAQDHQEYQLGQSVEFTFQVSTQEGVGMVATTGPKRPYPPEEGPSIPLTMVESRSPSTPSTKAPKRIPQKESQERAPSAFGKLKECASVFNQLVIVSCVFWPIYGTILLLEGFSGLGRAWGYGWAGKINGLVRFMDSILHWTHMVSGLM